VAVLLVMALGVLVAGPWLGHLIVDRLGLGQQFDWLWGIARWVGSALLVLVMWGALYRWLPDTDRAPPVFSGGAIAGVALWIVASLLLRGFLGRFGSYEKTYGTLAAPLIFLLWLWISNLAFPFGAEVSEVLAQLGHGSHRPSSAHRAAEARPRHGIPVCPAEVP
jgi:membrane protein